MSYPMLILGAGGHGRVLVDALLLQGEHIIGMTDRDPGKKGLEILGIEILGGDDIVDRYRPDELFLVNAVGSVKSTAERKALFKHFKDRKYRFSSVIHPSAVIGRDAVLGDNAIVNTNASVEHDCLIGAHVHIAPRSILSGGVIIGEGTLAGAGASVSQGVSIGKNCVIGAGAAVVRDVPDGKTALGVPARINES